MFGMWKGDIKVNTNISGASITVDSMNTGGMVKGLCLEYIGGGACWTLCKCPIEKK